VPFARDTWRCVYVCVCHVGGPIADRSEAVAVSAFHLLPLLVGCAEGGAPATADRKADAGGGWADLPVPTASFIFLTFSAGKAATSSGIRLTIGICVCVCICVCFGFCICFPLASAPRIRPLRRRIMVGSLDAEESWYAEA
jgi:hypothetical protein